MKAKKQKTKAIKIKKYKFFLEFMSNMPISKSYKEKYGSVYWVKISRYYDKETALKVFYAVDIPARITEKINSKFKIIIEK